MSESISSFIPSSLKEQGSTQDKTFSCAFTAVEQTSGLIETMIKQVSALSVSGELIVCMISKNNLHILNHLNKV